MLIYVFEDRASSVSGMLARRRVNTLLVAMCGGVALIERRGQLLFGLDET